MAKPFIEGEGEQTLIRSSIARRNHSFKHSIEASEQIFDTLGRKEESDEKCGPSPSNEEDYSATDHQFIFLEDHVSNIIFIYRTSKNS
jgi:hypothetical protein